jgi:hypothetical protein
MAWNSIRSICLVSFVPPLRGLTRLRLPLFPPSAEPDAGLRSSVPDGTGNQSQSSTRAAGCVLYFHAEWFEKTNLRIAPLKSARDAPPERSKAVAPAPGQERHLRGPDVGNFHGWDSLECSLAFLGFLSARSIEGDGCADERLERIRANLLTLVNVDGAPRVPVKARVEELRRIF